MGTDKFKNIDIHYDISGSGSTISQYYWPYTEKIGFFKEASEEGLLLRSEYLVCIWRKTNRERKYIK